MEYKTYWDIRFDRAPNLQKIMDNLNKIIDANKSCRACNTLAEVHHAQGSSGKVNPNPEIKAQAEQQAALAAKFYLISAEQGDVIGMHWMGVFYHEGFGVSKDIEKAIGFLKQAAEQGNCQSMYQLHLIMSGNDGQDDNFRDIEQAYQWLLKGIQLGATFFDEAIKYFKQHFDLLAPTFLKQRKLDIDIKDESKKVDVLNIHDAGINEMKNDFSTSLGKDRLYHKPCGFLNDQQIWMLGVTMNYFLHTVLRFDHKDFIKAVKVDLGVILGYTGLWALRCLSNHAKEVKDTELKKKVAVGTEIIEKYMESGLDVLGEEKKYLFINKFGPKKCPDQQVSRTSVKHLYSWTHYAPLTWFEHIKREKSQSQKLNRDG